MLSFLFFFSHCKWWSDDTDITNHCPGLPATCLLQTKAFKPRVTKILVGPECKRGKSQIRRLFSCKQKTNIVTHERVLKLCHPASHECLLLLWPFHLPKPSMEKIIAFLSVEWMVQKRLSSFLFPHSHGFLYDTHTRTHAGSFMSLHVHLRTRSLAYREKRGPNWWRFACSLRREGDRKRIEIRVRNCLGFPFCGHSWCHVLIRREVIARKLHLFIFYRGTEGSVEW